MRFWKRALAIAVLTLCCSELAGAASPAAEDGARSISCGKSTGPKGVYLLGTIHAGKADFYTLPSIIEDSFNKPNTLIEEIDLSQPAEAAHVERGLIEEDSYPNGRHDCQSSQRGHPFSPRSVSEKGRSFRGGRRAHAAVGGRHARRTT